MGTQPILIYWHRISINLIREKDGVVSTTDKLSEGTNLKFTGYPVSGKEIYIEYILVLHTIFSSYNYSNKTGRKL